MSLLHEEERAQLKAQHKKERDGRIRDQIKAVSFFDDGWTLNQIACVLLVSDESIRNHLDEYKKSQKIETFKRRVKRKTLSRAM